MAADKQSSVSPKDALWASVGMAALLVVAAVVLIVMDKDISGLVSIVNLMVIPILTGLGVLVNQKLTSVNENVNGRMTDLIDHAKNSTPIPKDGDTT